MKSIFIKKFKEFVHKYEIFSPKDRVLVAISGGADSVCLTKLLLELKAYKLELALVHINYHLRGVESDEDEQFVRDFALKNELPLKVVDFKKEKNLYKKKYSEEELRAFRFEVLEKLAKNGEFDKIALGHHLDDQLETFFINLFRGSGLAGLVSLKPIGVKSRVRPLLFTRKIEIESFLKKIKQPFCTDRTNLQADFFRNKLRLELLPLIELEYSPKIRKRINDLIQLLSGAQEAIQELELNNFERLVKSFYFKGKKSFFVEEREYLRLNSFLRGLIFRRIFSKLAVGNRELSKSNFEELEKMVLSQKSKKKIIIIGKVSVMKKKDRLVFFVN